MDDLSRRMCATWRGCLLSFSFWASKRANSAL
jgi:hypothetical protein